MQAATRDSPCPSEGRVLKMLDRIADRVEDYESTADDLAPVSGEEVERYRKDHPR